MKNLTRSSIWLFGALVASAATFIAMYTLEGDGLALAFILIGIVYVIFGIFGGQMLVTPEKDKNNS